MISAVERHERIAGAPSNSIAGAQTVTERAANRVLFVAALFCLVNDGVNLLFWFFNPPQPDPRVTQTGEFLSYPIGVLWVVFWAYLLCNLEQTRKLCEAWWIYVPVLALAKALTIALTCGLVSPLNSIGLVASWPIVIAAGAGAGLFAGAALCFAILLGSAFSSVGYTHLHDDADFLELARYAIQPIFSAFVALAFVAAVRMIFVNLGGTINDIRSGQDISTEPLKALLAGTPRLVLAAGSAETKLGPWSKLTDAEFDVLTRLRDGYTPAEIALERGTKLGTVRLQIGSAKRKFGARTQAHLVALSWKHS